MDRRSFLRRTMGGAAALSLQPFAASSGAWAQTASRTERTIGGQVFPRRAIPIDGPDIVMICIDDLNDWVGYLGHPLAITPNLDALAAQSMVFDNAYCSVPICMPSRASALTSTSPANSGMVGRIDQYAALGEDEGQTGYRSDGEACLERGICYEDILDSRMSVFDHFWLQGYRTAASGKVFHGWRSSDFDTFDARIQTYRKAYVSAIAEDPTFTQVGSFKWSKVQTENDHYDYLIANWMRRQLSASVLSRRQRPLFLVAGLFQPHVPWRIPRRFWDMYDPDQIDEVTEAEGFGDILDLPEEALDFITVGGGNALREEGKVSEAIHAYLAAITFADAQVGRIMNAFADSEIADSATVVLWSDHGRHLGEKLHWSKNTLWERSTRVPFLISSPELPKRNYKWPVSLLDMAPTLSRVAGLPDEPSWDGTSLTAQIGSPSAAHANPALMFWEDGNVAVRWKGWRLIQYRTGAIELYNRNNDPEEQHNLAVGDWQSNPLRVAAVEAMQAAIPPLYN